MEGFFKKSLLLAVLCSTGQALFADSNHAVPLISPRSRSVDSALEMVGLANHIHLSDMDCLYGTFAIAAQYARSFREDKSIVPCLFGGDVSCDGCPTLNISGRCAADRKATDWLADYFGLPQDFKSVVTFNPRMDSFSVDFNFYIGLNSWWEGLYFRVHAPVEHVRYKLGFEESVTNAGTQAHNEGYFSEAYIPRTNLLGSFKDFVVNQKVPVLNGQESNADTDPVTSVVKFNPLTCARFAGCERLDKTRLADIRAALGWNFWQDCDYHLGIELRVAAPTGNRPEGEFLFEPIVGNGHHWELGGGINGHILFWESDCESSHFGLWVDAHITHLFKARQHRFFDLKNGGNSRYMLAMKMKKPAVNLFGNPVAGDQAGSVAPSAQFADLFSPVANLTCCDVDVSVGVQGDVSAMFNYTNCGFSWDIGYNFWGRSCEKIETDCDCPCTIGDGTWALKGDAHVYGFTAGQDEPTVIAADQAIALSGTESKATIHAGTNVPLGTLCEIGVTDLNPGVDNAQFARLTAGAAGLGADIRNLRTTHTPVPDIAQTRTSVNPIILKESDIDFDGARTKGQSHKIFTHISYTWQDTDCWTPYIGVGAKAEFAPSKDCCSTSACPTTGSSTSSSTSSCNTSCDSDCDSCERCNFSEWGVWVKGGISFD